MNKTSGYIRVIPHIFLLSLIFSMIAAPALLFASETRLTLREKTTGNSSAQLEIGDTLTVEVFVSVDTVKSQGVSFYVTFDDSIFSLVDRAAAGDTMIRPFDFAGGKYGTNGNENDTHNDPGNGIDDFQIDGSIIRSIGSLTGDGVVAAFYLVALRSADTTVISLDYDLGEHRDTRLHVLNGGSEQFKVLDNLTASVGTVSGVEESRPVSVPWEFTLRQNYPNPFNPETKISFSLESSGGARLEIFNATGQLIRTLLYGQSSILGAGEHSVTWDGRDNAGIPVASGVYIYRLSVGDNNASKKMLLIR